MNSKTQYDLIHTLSWLKASPSGALINKVEAQLGKYLKPKELNEIGKQTFEVTGKEGIIPTLL